MKKITAAISALVLAACSMTSSFCFAEDTNEAPAALTASPVLLTSSDSSTADESASYEMNVKVDLSSEGKKISPYIFGVNEHGISKNTTVNAVRQGGNRYTAYNWETNYSNAGSDWKNSSDTYLSDSNDPADCAKQLSKKAEKYSIPYKLTTLQMAGYVSADKNGEVSKDETAPGERWNEVVFSKDGELSDTPDLTDGKVYMDEYVNYLVKNLGDSQSATGIQGYSLDNEPALWSSTHSLVHPEKAQCDEMITKSAALAKSVKNIDKNAEIFGPALYGYAAFATFQDDDEGTIWKNTYGDQYDWFLSFYLDKMKEESEKEGQRLLDVLDVHYYTEAKGTCGQRMCSDPTHTECIDAMLQSYRTLCEKGYQEDSWIGEWCQVNLPLLPKIQETIDKYYPGTKLAVSEYDMGGGKTIAGAIAEIDTLGTFAKNDVYLATLWAENVPYQFSAINMYTNFDGKGTAFGDTLIDSQTDDYVKSTSYASINGDDQSKATVIVTNKSQTETEKAVISLENADVEYKNAAVYVLSGDTSEIVHVTSIDKIDENTFTIELPPLSAAEVYVTSDEDGFRPVEEKPEEEVFIKLPGVLSANVTDELTAYSAKFENPVGSTMAFDVVVPEGCPMVSGGLDFNVTLDGQYYWVCYDWSTDHTGEVKMDMSMPTSTFVDDETCKDEELLAKLGQEIMKNSKDAEVQIWYVADKNWDGQATSLASVSSMSTYVSENEFDYGDFNADGVVDLTDLTIMSLNLLGDYDVDSALLKYFDVDASGEYNIGDLAHLKRYIVKDEGAVLAKK